MFQVGHFFLKVPENSTNSLRRKATIVLLTVNPGGRLFLRSFSSCMIPDHWVAIRGILFISPQNFDDGCRSIHASYEHHVLTCNCSMQGEIERAVYLQLFLFIVEKNLSQKPLHQIYLGNSSLLGVNSPMVTCISACLMSRDHDCLCSGLFFQGCLCSKWPWKIKVMSSSRVKSRSAYCLL